MNSGRWNTIASKSIVTDGTISSTNAKLGVFDPTLLENDQYEVRLTAKDINGLTASDSIELNVLGHAKIGALQFPSTEQCDTCHASDVTIPVAGGPPIMVSRKFNSLTADESGSFGHGWQYCMAEPRIRSLRSVPGTFRGSTRHFPRVQNRIAQGHSILLPN
ncbi:MAG: hypothetical protein K9M08_23400 [Pirellula sp.]|nr:hypothetical protein [Pirellula sp.]